jgi:hypothetical protein
MRIYVLLLILLVSVFAPIPAPAQQATELYNAVGTVSGHVELIDHPVLGRTPCRHCGFLIQRVDCRRCIVYVKTDENGAYSARVGLGRWRVIMKARHEEVRTDYDLLAKDQPREFELKSPGGELKFDIRSTVGPG